MNFTKAVELAMNGVRVKRYSYSHKGRIYMFSQIFKDENILYVKDTKDCELRLTEEDIFALDWERSKP